MHIAVGYIYRNNGLKRREKSTTTVRWAQSNGRVETQICGKAIVWDMGRDDAENMSINTRPRKCDTIFKRNLTLEKSTK